MQSVCNLGVWCISVQQFSERVLVSRFDSLLQAVVHGLDNPFASLSTTFEAIQVETIAKSLFINFFTALLALGSSYCKNNNGKVCMSNSLFCSI